MEGGCRANRQAALSDRGARSKRGGLCPQTVLADHGSCADAQSLGLLGRAAHSTLSIKVTSVCGSACKFKQ